MLCIKYNYEFVFVSEVNIKTAFGRASIINIMNTILNSWQLIFLVIIPCYYMIFYYILFYIGRLFQ